MSSKIDAPELVSVGGLPNLRLYPKDIARKKKQMETDGQTFHSSGGQTVWGSVQACKELNIPCQVEKYLIDGKTGGFRVVRTDREFPPEKLGPGQAIEVISTHPSPEPEDGPTLA